MVAGGGTPEPLFGERLQIARDMANLTQAEVAEAAGIARETLSRWEKSFRNDVTSESVNRLALTLSFPVAFFKEPPTPGFADGSLRFRAKKSISKTELRRVRHHARMVRDTISAMSMKIRWAQPRIPQLQSGMDLEEVAALTRNALGLAPGSPIDNVTRSLERAGVAMVAFPWPDSSDHDAFSTWLEGAIERPLIVVNVIDSWERTRWSTAHEVGHLVLHRVPSLNDEEQEAHDFANEFLFPEVALRSEWPQQATLSEILPLKHRWGMSISALIQHAYRSGLLTDTRRVSLFRQMSARKWREREPGWEWRLAEKPRALSRMAEISYGNPVDIDSLAKDSGNWPPMAVRRLLAAQATSPIRTAKVANASPDEELSGRVLSINFAQNGASKGSGELQA